LTTLNAFESIKDTLSIADVTAFYGVEVKKANKALCPFHSENTPSFTLYPGANSWHCFGCGTGGSVIDFVMRINGTDALEAAKTLDSDFNLRIFGHKPTQEEACRQAEQRARRQSDKQLETAFEGFIDKAYCLLCDYFHLLQDWKIVYAPITPGELDTVNPLFAEACHQLDYTEYLLDFLLSADIDGKIGFYNTHRKELLNLADRIKPHTNGTKADNPA
jgi:hypothetical protein